MRCMFVYILSATATACSVGRGRARQARARPRHAPLIRLRPPYLKAGSSRERHAFASTFISLPKPTSLTGGGHTASLELYRAHADVTPQDGPAAALRHTATPRRAHTGQKRGCVARASSSQLATPGYRPGEATRRRPARPVGRRPARPAEPPASRVGCRARFAAPRRSLGWGCRRGRAAAP